MPSSSGEESGAIAGFVALLRSELCFPLVVFVLALTLLVVSIELTSRSKSSLKSCLSARSLIYFVILLLGNLLASLIVLVPTVTAATAAGNAWGYAVFGSVAGVFSFEGVLSNTNITIFNRGVLTISDWIGRARDAAVAFAVAEEANSDNRKLIANAQALAQLDDAVLNTHIANALGPMAVAQLNQEAVASDAEPRLYKALKLATDKADYVKSVL